MYIRSEGILASPKAVEACRSMNRTVINRSLHSSHPLTIPSAALASAAHSGMTDISAVEKIRQPIRICRPVGLSQEDCGTVCNYAISRIGFDYDLRNIIDLMRFLVPLPVPQRWRRRMIALGSGTPTRIICSALIAQAFNAVRYPILPKVTQVESEAARREILEIRHSSLYAPRDFDISPYFRLVKPTVERGFDYRSMQWADVASVSTPPLVAEPDPAGTAPQTAT